jgi:hypothetical protein
MKPPGTTVSQASKHELTIELEQWNIFRTHRGYYHLVGRHTATRLGHVSCAVWSLDSIDLRARSVSRNTYLLKGPPGSEIAALEVWAPYASLNDVLAWINVTDGVWAAHCGPLAVFLSRPNLRH